MLVGAIDIGSNSILLSIAKPSNEPAGYELIYDEARVTGIAKGLGPQDEVSEKALEKSTQCLRDYSSILRKHAVEKLQVVATEGLRKPKNSLEIKAVLEKALGQPIEIIDGNREAELSFKSVAYEISDESSESLVFDIGGASTEIVYGRGTSIVRKESLRIGSVLLCRQFNMSETSTYGEAVAFVKEMLKKSSFNEGSKYSRATAAGVAGTITSLASILLEQADYSREKVHGYKVKLESLTETLARLSKLPLFKRMSVAGLAPERADVFPAGLSIATALAEHFSWKEFSCMDSGVRIGLIYEMLRSN
jgi:exopolyphosphatase/guanosine-5'-triphosphate,3'-diphosphate pyrophosphatase